jgi:hypothetical protein
MRSFRRFRTAAAGGLAWVAGCDGASAPSGDGRIVVRVTADAPAPPGSGFSLTLNGRQPKLLSSPGVVVYAGVASGTHQVHLFGLPEGCVVLGENPRVVRVIDDGTATADFAVSCGRPGSAGFRVEVATTGEPLDDDGYQLAVSGAPLRVIEINAVETYTGLAPGVHLITMKDMLPACQVRGGNPQPFTAVPGKTLVIRLQVICGSDPGPL